MVSNLILFAFLVAQQLLDVWTTQRIIAGGGRELNPVLNWLMERYGLMRTLVVWKVLAMVLLWHFLDESEALRTALWILIAGYALVLLNHWRILRN
jgi:hypothetical protein